MAFPLFSPRRDKGGAGAATAPAPPVAAPDSERPRRTAHTYACEAGALLLIASALYVALALGSFQGDPMRVEVSGDDWVGPVGALVAGTMATAIGISAWLVPMELLLLAAPLLGGKRTVPAAARVGGDVVVVAVIAALCHVAFPESTTFGAMPLGGSVGQLFGEVLRTLFSDVGSYIVGCTVVLLILVGRATFSFIEQMQRLERAVTAFLARAGAGLRALLGAWARAREVDRDNRDRARRAAEPLIAAPAEADAIIAALADDDAGSKRPTIEPVRWPLTVIAADPEEAYQETGPMVLLGRMRAATAAASAGAGLAMLAADAPTPSPVGTRKQRRRAVVKPLPERAFEAQVEEAVEHGDELGHAARATEVATPSALLPVEARSGAAAAGSVDEAAPRARRPAPKKQGIRIVDTSAALVTEKADPSTVVVPAIGQGFRLPSTEMLEPAEATRIVIDESQLKATAQLLEKTLADYGVSGKVEEIHPGPTVTTFEVSPAAGTRVSKVASLADDLALGLSRKVRIIAPIPGKNRIGFEIPNEHRVPVNMRELVDDRRFVEMKAPLPCVLGRDIIGAPYFADLASMPHVIVAGATGAGKSVGLNVMLVSLLFRRTPADLRLLMIDPKVVELAPFDRIPHMLLPVVTDMKQAANALKWAVDEMERRYQLFANAGTKNIGTYNAWVGRCARGEAKPPKPKRVAAVAPDGTEVEVDAAKDGSDVEMPEKIPFIVIVVDEFADLMMQQGKDVETAVARLAQKARAAGMHVILATQRPSVDVITGMIKANFPTRIAFRVAQKVDSRTILDEQGAEHLLGRGDMLIKMNGSNETRRVQCPFVSEEEVQRICDFLRLQGEPVYDEDILKPRDEEGEPADAGDAESDPMYDAAVRIVAETRRCSTSWIQRKLGVGYNRAAKIVETMERRGLVGPSNGAKDREVLVAPL
ncbi:MAG: DNA translocase FtsK 4TM domain-containing protein [Polyangiaceae bacterium]